MTKEMRALATELEKNCSAFLSSFTAEDRSNECAMAVGKILVDTAKFIRLDHALHHSDCPHEPLMFLFENEDQSKRESGIYMNAHCRFVLQSMEGHTAIEVPNMSLGELMELGISMHQLVRTILENVNDDLNDQIATMPPASA